MGNQLSQTVSKVFEGTFNSAWSLGYEQSWPANTELDPELRQRQIETFIKQTSVQGSDDLNKMQKTAFDFDSAAAKEMFQMLAHLDEHPTGSWSTHKHNFYLETLKNSSRNNSPAFINMHQIKLMLAQFLNAVNDSKITRQYDIDKVKMNRDRYVEVASDILKEKSEKKAERTLSEGKRNLMINLLQGLLSDIVDAQSPDQSEILQEIIFKVKAISEMQNASDQLPLGETEIFELVQEMVKQLINLMFIQTEGLTNFSRMSKEDCESFVEFIAKLVCYLGTPSFSFDVLASLIQIGVPSHFSIPWFYSPSNPSSAILLEKPSAKLELPQVVVDAKIGHPKVFASKDCYYICDKDNKSVYLCARSSIVDKLTLLEGTTASFETDNYLALFDGALWSVNEKSFSALKIDPRLPRDARTSVNLKTPNAESTIEQEFPGSKVTFASMLAICGDDKGNVYFLCFYKLVVSNENKRCFVLSRQRTKAGSNETEIVSNVVVKFEGKPWVQNGHGQESYLNVGLLGNRIVLHKKDTELSMIDLETDEISFGSYVNTHTTDVEGLPRKVHGFDSTTASMLSLGKKGELFQRDLTFLCNLDTATSKKRDAGSLVDLQKLAQNIGLALEQDQDSNNVTSGPKKADSNSFAVQNISKSIFSLMRELSNYKSFLDLDFYDNSRWPDFFESLINQRCFHLDTKTFESLQKLSVQVAGLNDPKLNLVILAILDIYLEQTVVFQEFESSREKIISQKTLLYLRLSVEQMAKANTKNLSEAQAQLWDKLIVRVYTNIIMMTRKAKTQGFEGIVHSVLSENHEHSYSVLRAIVQELTVSFSQKKSFDNGSQFMEVLTTKLLELSAKVLKEESAVLRDFHKGGQVISPKLRVLKSNLWSVFSLLVRNHKYLKEEVVQRVKEFSKGVTQAFISDFEEFAKNSSGYLSVKEQLDRFDSFVMESYSGNIFYRYVTILMFDESSENADELADISKRYVALCKGLTFAHHEGSPASSDTSSVTVELETVSPKLVKYQLVSMPLFKEVVIEVSGIDPRYDTLMVCSTHVVDREKIVDCRPYHTVVVPHRFVQHNGKVKVGFSEMVLALRSEIHEGFCKRKITAKVSGIRDDSGYKSKIQAFNEICLQIMIESCRSTFTASISTETPEIPEKQKKMLTTILDSKVFYNGIDVEKHLPVTMKLDAEGTTIHQKCVDLHTELLRKLKIPDSAIDYFNKFCDDLHEDTRRTIHSQLLGDLGLVIIKSVFAVVLYQKGMIETVIEHMLDATKLKSVWIKCNLLRVVCRTFESDSQFEELYNKIFLLCAVEPLEADLEPPMSTLLNPTKSMVEKVAPMLKALKVFFDDLKLKNMVQSRSASSEVPEQIVRFLSIKVDTTEIVKFLKAKRKEAEDINSVLKTIEALMENSASIMEVLTILNQVFRKDSKRLDYLTPDYSGLSHDMTKMRVRSIQRIIIGIVDYLCTISDPDAVDKKMVLFALDSLKWLWRAQETYCVGSIDMEGIICNNWALISDPEIQASVVELSGSILIFCANQFDEKGLKKSSQRDIALSNGVSQMVNTNVSYLVSVISDGLQFLDSRPSIEYEGIYKRWSDRHANLKRHRLADRVMSHAREIDENPEVYKGEFISIDNETHLDPIDMKVEQIQNQTGLTPAEPSIVAAPQAQIQRQMSNASGIGWLFDNPETSDQAGATEVISDKKTEPVTSDYSTLLQKHSQSQEKVLLVIENIINSLTHLYYLVQNLEKHSDPYIPVSLVTLLGRLVVSAYPEPIKAIAMRVMTIMSHARGHLEGFDFKQILAWITGHYRSLFAATASHINVNHHLKFVRSLLDFEEIGNQVKDMLVSKDDAAVIAALDIIDSSCSVLEVGSLVRQVSDQTGELYVVLQKKAGLLATALTRDYLVYRYDLKRFTSEGLELNNLNHKLLTMCLRTKNFRFFSKNEVEICESMAERDLMSRIVQNVDLAKVFKGLGSSTCALYAKYRLANICSMSGLPELTELTKELAKVTSKDLPSTDHMTDLDLNNSVSIYFRKVAKDESAKLASIRESPEIVENLKFSSLKSKLYSSIKNHQKTSSTEQATPKNYVEQNLYYYAKPEAEASLYMSNDTRTARDQPESTIKSMLATLIKRVSHSAQTRLKGLKTDGLQVIKDFLSKATEPKALYLSIKSLESKFKSSKLEKNTLPDVVSTLFDLSLALLGDNATWNNLYTTKSFVYAVEIIVHLAYQCTEPIAISDCETKIDALLSKVEVTSYRLAMTTMIHRNFESLQYVVLLLARYAIVLFRPVEANLKQHKCHAWLSLLNEQLAAVTRADDQQDDIIIKGILMNKLQENEKAFNDNPWRVTLTDEKTRQSFDTGKYKSWMFVGSKDSRYLFALYKDQEKEPFHIYRAMNSYDKRDLAIEIEFKADPQSKVFVDYNFPLKDYFMTSRDDGLYEVLGSSISDDEYLYTTNSILVARGVAYFKDPNANNYYPLVTGITCANSDRSLIAMYKKESRELFLYNHNYMRYDEKPMEAMITSYSLYPVYCLRLDSFPVITSVLKVFKDLIVVLKAEDGSVIVQYQDLYDADERQCFEAMMATLELLSFFYYGKKLDYTPGGIKVFKPQAGVMEIEQLVANLDRMASLFCHTAEGSDIYVYVRGCNVLTVVRFTGEKITKICVTQEQVVALFESGKVFVSDRIELRAENEDSQTLHKQEIKNPSFAGFGRILDICLKEHESVIGIESYEEDGTQKFRFVTVSGSAISFTPHWNAWLTEKSRFVEAQNNHSSEMVIKNTKSIEYGASAQNDPLIPCSPKSLEYPLAMTIDKENAMKIVPLAEQSKLNEEELVIIQTMPMVINCSWNDELIAYKESGITEEADKPFDPQVLTTAGCIYWSPTQGIKALEKVPDDLSTLGDYVLLFKPKTKFMKAITTLVTKITSKLKFLNPENYDYKLNFFPNFIKMTNEEFAEFKEEVKPLWEPEFEQAKQSYSKYKTLAIDITMKSLENQYSGRSMPFQFLINKDYLTNRREWGYFNGTEKEGFEESKFHLAMSCLRVLNLYYNYFYMRLPVFEQRCLDPQYLKNSEPNVFGSFFISMFKPHDVASSRSIEMNKFKAIKYTTLSRQNFSILNQYAYGFDSCVNHKQTSRYHAERISYRLKGEGSIDAGGPRRELMEYLTTELVEKLCLFIPTPNNVNNVGEERDRMIPNPSANSATDLENFYKVGMAIAQVARQYDMMPLRLPLCFWKYLCGHALTWQQYANININQFNCLIEMEKMTDDQLEALQEDLIVYLPDGKNYELVPGGKTVSLNRHNRSFYAEAIKRVLLAQLELPFYLMREGFRSVVPNGMIVCTTPENLEKYICGAEFVDIDILKKITQYKGFDEKPLDHPSVKYFWNILSAMTQEELSLYLRYVWGRSRLGNSSVDTHKLTYVSDRKNDFPEAHTCFFELDLFDYDSEETLRDKLHYVIKNCFTISESDNTLHIEDL